jgi:hypothetical protein
MVPKDLLGLAVNFDVPSGPQSGPFKAKVKAADAGEERTDPQRTEDNILVSTLAGLLPF